MNLESAGFCLPPDAGEFREDGELVLLGFFQPESSPKKKRVSMMASLTEAN